jgi:NADH-quinone oxidoreductase subunit F
MSDSFQKILQDISAANDTHEDNVPVVIIGTATCGVSAGADEVLKKVKEYINKEKSSWKVMEVGCIGLCFEEPLMGIVFPGKSGVYYKKVTPEKAVSIITGTKSKDSVYQEDVLGSFGMDNIKNIKPIHDLPVMKLQKRRVLKRCGYIDPQNISHYIAEGGYAGLDKVLSMSSKDIIDELKDAGLNGRGGAGFPTWKKWQFCIDNECDQKYVVCNADEGDPGAFMNRSVLEGDPHMVIEGLTIAGYTVGADTGYVYCRAEYPLAIKHLKHAIIQAKEKNLLGDNILGSGFSFTIKVKEGAGAFVCGEETALLASIEGQRGTPRTRPPFPAVSGLWGKPTIINNVETLASVSLVFAHGASWFAGCGTEESKGTKTFALVGKVKNSGLVEVPLGTTLKEMTYDVGGGIVNEKQIKAIQTGGPSGGCIPASLLDTPVDYQSLGKVGSIMGSGGMVVMDEDTCMVDVARYFLDFTQKESCGKCTPCRLGTRQMLQILEDITNGHGKPEDIEYLQELAEGVKKGSLCGLGQTAPNPVLTTLKYFMDEYKAHIHEKRCPACSCKELIEYIIDEERCTGCHLCYKVCPSQAISGELKKQHEIDQEACIKCGLCFSTCPEKFDAIKKVSKPAGAAS